MVEVVEVERASGSSVLGDLPLLGGEMCKFTDWLDATAAA